MTEILLSICAAFLLVLDAATLIFATLALRAIRRYVDLAEERMERLRKGQGRLLGLPTDEQQELSEELERERHARRDAGRTIDRLKRELAELRGARREASLPAMVGTTSRDRREASGLSERDTSPNRDARKDEGMPPTSIRQTSAYGAHGPSGDTKPRLGVRHPHPDDAIVGSTLPSERARPRAAAPVDVFRKHYDKYLDNYRGYVELAEHLSRMRDGGAMEPGSFEEHHWEERLRRVNDGIERTIARLDILEGQNPALAADDRVSRRAIIARRHSELG